MQPKKDRYSYVPKHHMALANVHDTFKEGLRGSSVIKEEYSPISEKKQVKKVEKVEKDIVVELTSPVRL